MMIFYFATSLSFVMFSLLFFSFDSIHVRYVSKSLNDGFSLNLVDHSGFERIGHDLLLLQEVFHTFLDVLLLHKRHQDIALEFTRVLIDKHPEVLHFAELVEDLFQVVVVVGQIHLLQENSLCPL